jgi:hypothetical protein
LTGLAQLKHHPTNGKPQQTNNFKNAMEDPGVDESAPNEESLSFGYDGGGNKKKKQDLPKNGKTNSTLTKPDKDDASYNSNDSFFCWTPPCWMLVVLVCLVLLVIGGIVTGVVVGNNKRNDDEARIFIPATNAPITPAVPSSAPTTVEASVLTLFASVVGDDVYTEGTPAYSAANWILYDDPRAPIAGPAVQKQLSSSSSSPGEESLQRFLLALFYFATTENGEKPWLSCNPPPEGSSPLDFTCVFLQGTEHLGDGELTYEGLRDAVRWLSAEEECDWQGITCDEFDNVVGIELGMLYL